MSDPVKKLMTADAFIAWAMEQPEANHYELSGGEVVATAPERVSQNRANFRLRENWPRPSRVVGSTALS